MLVYAGIDEAGYGPILGSLVVTRCVFELPELAADTHPPSLWSLLRAAVCRRPADDRRRIPVNDSKLLYQPASGPARLELGVLSFLKSLDWTAPTLDDLLRLLAFDELSFPDHQPWYSGPQGGPALRVQVQPAMLRTSRKRLMRVLERVGLRLVDDCGSKAACNWIFVAVKFE